MYNNFDHDRIILPHIIVIMVIAAKKKILKYEYFEIKEVY